MLLAEWLLGGGGGLVDQPAKTTKSYKYPTQAMHPHSCVCLILVYIPKQYFMLGVGADVSYGRGVAQDHRRRCE